MGINPFNQMLGQIQTAPVMQGLSQAIGMAKAAQNPQAALSQLVQNNPQIQQVMSFVQKNGGDAKALFYQMAQQKGIDPDKILNQAREMMK